MKEEKSDEVLKPPCQTRSLASRPRADLGLSGPIDVPSAKSARGLQIGDQNNLTSICLHFRLPKDPFENVQKKRQNFRLFRIPHPLFCKSVELSFASGGGVPQTGSILGAFSMSFWGPFLYQNSLTNGSKNRSVNEHQKVSQGGGQGSKREPKREPKVSPKVRKIDPKSRPKMEPKMERTSEVLKS